MFHPACGQKCKARKSDAPRFGCLSKFGETEETAAHHLFTYVCLTHVGDQATTHKRQRARIDHATGARDMGDIRNRGPQKRWKEGLDRRLSDSVYFDAAAADPKDAYQFDFKMPSSSGMMVPVCKSFFRTALGYKSDDRQWRAALSLCMGNPLCAITAPAGRDSGRSAEVGAPHAAHDPPE